MNNFFGKIAEQATGFIEKNPDKVESFKHQAAGFLKTAVDKESEKEAQKVSSGQEMTKAEQMKAQALGVLQPKLDQFVDAFNANDETNDDDDTAATKPPPGKPSDDEAEEPQEESATSAEEPPAPPPKKRPTGKPSYLIAKKKNPDDDDE